MILLAPVLLGYGVVLFLTRPGTDHQGNRVAAFYTVLLVLLSVFGMFMALLGSSDVTCEATCNGPAWRENPHAWQYTAQLFPALIGLAATLWALVGFVRGKRHQAFVSTAIATLAWAVWLVIWS